MACGLTDHLDYASAVRLLVIDMNTRPNFYFVTEDGRKEYLEMPAGTNSFAYHNQRVLHAADYLGSFKVIGHLVIDQIDEDRWFKMLRSSQAAWPERSLVA